MNRWETRYDLLFLWFRHHTSLHKPQRVTNDTTRPPFTAVNPDLCSADGCWWDQRLLRRRHHYRALSEGVQGCLLPSLSWLSACCFGASACFDMYVTCVLRDGHRTVHSTWSSFTTFHRPVLTDDVTWRAELFVLVTFYRPLDELQVANALGRSEGPSVEFECPSSSFHQSITCYTWQVFVGIERTKPSALHVALLVKLTSVSGCTPKNIMDWFSANILKRIWQHKYIHTVYASHLRLPFVIFE